MATVIQNLACFEVVLDTQNGRIYFDEDILKNKTIKNIWLFFASEDTRLYSPLSPDKKNSSLSPLDYTLNRNSFFLNIVDAKGEIAVKNLDCNYLMLTNEDFRSRFLSMAQLTIDRSIDTKNSFFNIFRPDIANKFKFLMYVSYEDSSLKISDYNVKGCFSVEIPIPAGAEIFDARLSDFVPRSYRDKKIKQILFSSDVSCSFLDLKADNIYIENIPSAILYSIGTTNTVYFDNLNIDYEESFLRFRGATDPVEKEKITFLY